MNEIILGVCGSVAAYKAAILIRLLKPSFAVQPIMTPMAQKFIGAATLRALSGRAVAVEEWNAPLSDDGMDHIALPRAAQGMIIAPASADFIAKAAAGMADNLLLSAFLATSEPRWLAPAMNMQMWQKAVTQRNIQKLAADGVIILNPTEGEQACGDNGPGRMMDPEDIAQYIYRHFASPIRGRHIVVSAGATAEKIDDMRIISNISSGKMGFCIAEAAHHAGAKVTIIAAQTTAPPPFLPIHRVLSGKQMQEEVMRACKQADVFISAAAVADFIPAIPVSGKIERQRGNITLELSATDDILASVAAHYPSLLTVGFAAQSGVAAQRIKAAKQKMLRKKITMMAVNSVLDAGGDSSQLTLLSINDKIIFPRQSKAEAARALVAEIASVIVSRETIKEAQ